jgi:hypothetical protein
MSIIEEQSKNDGQHADITGNMAAPYERPPAKKVYAKPTLVVLLQATTHGKLFPSVPEITPQGAGGPS